MSKSQRRKVLVVDDEADVTELVTHRLRREGYDVQAINDPLLIMGVAHEFDPDLFILDIMMNDLDGLQICRMIRADKRLGDRPIMFLTARGEATDRIQGLEIGADDYLPKPFDIKELILRAGLLLKRRGTAGEKNGDATLIVVGGIRLAPELHRVEVDGQPVDLTPTEFKLLRLLMERRGRVQTRDNLLVNVWNYDTDTTTRTIDTHVRRLREKLGPYAALIETVRGVGYRMKDA